MVAAARTDITGQNMQLQARAQCVHIGNPATTKAMHHDNDFVGPGNGLQQ